uniref:C-type lectin domain-containing protein n=1 Tax=Panagrellus redivivus TaxID=6233 RepID=A0A7E4UYY0_PANRE
MTYCIGFQISGAQLACEQYDQVLQPYWSSPVCAIPIMKTPEYKCPDDTYTVVPTTFYFYCYKLISKGSITLDDENIVDTANEYCIEETGGLIASIHDEAENGYVNALLNITGSNGVMIGMKADVEGGTLYWSDGTATDYDNFGTQPTVTANYTMTIMTSSGDWTADPAKLLDFNYIASVSVVNRTVDGIQQLIQNVVYNLQRPCPDYWNQVGPCTLKMTEEACNQYSGFLETYWNGSFCQAPMMKQTFECPDNTYTVVSNNQWTYCYKLISKGTINIDDENIVDMANEYCIEQTGGQIASIYDKKENAGVNAQCFGKLFNDNDNVVREMDCRPGRVF